ncbi:HAD family hydrolase [Lachnospiraceae bacterium ZAX-1]
MATIDTVIFDLDGTLLDTLDDLSDSVNYVMLQHHFPHYTKEDVRKMVGNGIRTMMKRALPNGEKNTCYEQCIKEFQAYYATHMQHKTVPFSGIIPCLERLQQSGMKLAVVSNKFDHAVKLLCEEHFSSYIKTAIGESPSTAPKPAPDTVFRAIKELGSTVESCIYVGDSEVDIETAKNAHMPCISVSWGFKDRKFLQDHGAKIIVDRVKELTDYLIKKELS